MESSRDDDENDGERKPHKGVISLLYYSTTVLWYLPPLRTAKHLPRTMQITIATVLLSLLGSTAAFAPHASSARCLSCDSKLLQQDLPTSTAFVLLPHGRRTNRSTRSRPNGTSDRQDQEMVTCAVNGRCRIRAIG
jgi:hypothetical protein